MTALISGVMSVSVRQVVVAIAFFEDLASDLLIAVLVRLGNCVKCSAQRLQGFLNACDLHWVSRTQCGSRVAVFGNYVPQREDQIALRVTTY